MAKSRNGPHKAPFIGELAAKGGLEVKRSAPTHKTAGCVFFCDLRSFPSPVCDTVGDDPEDVPEGVPSRIPCIARIYDEWHSVVIQS